MLNIVGLQEKKVTNVEQLMQIIEHGQSIRVTGQNSTNLESSRSHALV
jgi:kinesin family member 2/24